MDLNEPPKKRRAESIVPMINVVFLLLIFFLMTSQLLRPEPFDVTPPEAATQAEVKAQPILFVTSEGRLSFDGAEGEDAIAAIAAQSRASDVIQIRTDANLKAAAFARILQNLAAVGLSRVELVVSKK